MSRRKPVVGSMDQERNAILHIARARAVPVAVPVVVPVVVNGRGLESWEMGLYVEWAERERRRELAMFEGLIG